MSQRLELPWRSMLLAAVALAVAASPEARGALALERTAVLDGELWRIWSGHLVHGSAYHLWWNVLPLIGLGLFYEPLLGRRIWTLLAIGAPAVGVGLLLLDPALGSYCGLSGVLNSIWVGGAMLAAREEGAGTRKLYAWCAVAGLVKVGAEAWIGRPLLTDASSLGGVPVPLAHALGLLGGLVWWLGAPALARFGSLRRRAGQFPSGTFTLDAIPPSPQHSEPVAPLVNLRSPCGTLEERARDIIVEGE